MWRDLFPKVFKWCLSACCLIWGLGLLWLVSLDEKTALFPAVICFGIVYWQYKSRSEIPLKVALGSIAVFAAGAGAALYLPVDHFPFNFGFFPAWSAWTTVLGLPVITYAFWKS